MLILLIGLSEHWPFFNVFRYITFRTGGAIMTSLVFALAFGPAFISGLSRWQGQGQPIREDGPAGHLTKKQGTPTMGGILILAGITVSAILWADLSNVYVWMVIIIMLAFGLIGFADDRIKLMRRSHKGLTGKSRLLLEFILSGAIVMAVSVYGYGTLSPTLAFPFFKDVIVNLWIMFIPFAAFVITGSANAVNLTDGLDGLAIVPVMIAAAAFGLIAYLSGNIVFANYLQIQHVAGSGELAVLCGAIIGAGMGFLWFNAPPAAVFMGDTGSLGLGGALGAIAVAAKHEIILAIVGFLFVVEAASVMMQVASYKLTGRRIFKMAPIHHHFEQLGWPESQIVIRFWILAVVFALIGLSSLKLR